jgi:hypothetical protein
MDSRTYQENLTSAATRIKVPEGSQLVIVAAGWPAEDANGAPFWRTGQLSPSELRPHLRGTIEAVGTAAADSAAPGSLILNGLLIEGGIALRSGHLGAFQLAHCTLPPGFGTLTCEDNPTLTIDLTRVICGDITLATSARGLRLTDCIVDGDVAARDVAINASTIFGTTQAETLQASNSILLGPVTAARRQIGCVRFSYLPFESESPRRYWCQPESAAQAARVRPRFESVAYGEPAFAQLAGSGAPEIASGADDEGEMGAWHFLQTPLRLRNLRLALDEYLRFGLEAGVFLVPQQPRLAAAAVREMPPRPSAKRAAPRQTRPVPRARRSAGAMGTATARPVRHTRTPRTRRGAQKSRRTR